MRRFLNYCLMLGCLGGFALGAPRAHAATLTVTTVNDSTTVDGCNANDCTLREAVTAANANSDTDNIVFANGLAGGTITLATALPDLTTSLNITNPAAQRITVTRDNSAGNFQILAVIGSGDAEGGSDDDFNTAPTGPTVALQGLTLTNGRTVGSGAGNYRFYSGAGLYVGNSTVSVTNCVLSDNIATYYGGGLSNDGGAVTLVNSTIANNKASSFGGGILSVNGTLSVTNSTVNSNAINNFGGGFEIEFGTLNITNSTVTGNTAYNGAGIRSYDSTVTVRSCTVTGNTASNDGGGLYAESGTGSVTLSNSIVAANASNDLSTGGNTNTFASAGYNLVGTGSASALAVFTAGKGDQTGVTAAQLNLGVLANNGGPTQTIAIGQNSLAFNAGDPGVASSLTTYDQRGNPYRRVIGGRIDVGAYEFQGPLTGFNDSLVVTTLTDEDDGTSDPSIGAGTSLREAINYANSNADQSDITFAPGLQGGTLMLNTALPTLSTDLTINNPATTIAQTITLARNTVAGTPNFRILTAGTGATNGPTVGLTGLTLTGGNLTGTNVSTSVGGGLLNNGGTVSLFNCTVRGNTTQYYGGGIENSGGTLTLTNCTVSGNTASSFGGGIDSVNSFTTPTTTLTNCTLSGNTLAENGNGGGVFVSGTGTLTNCTISGNSAFNGGGINISGSGTLSNIIVVGNTATNAGGDIFQDGTLTSQGYNLVGDTNATTLTQSGDQTGVISAQVNLGDLADNGGPTQTRALQAGSIAINAGNTTLTTDQRGVARPQANIDDVGAYEFDGTFNESLVVTTLTDEDNGTSDPAFGGGTSLREAINYANSNADQSNITFADGLAGGTLTLTQALPNLSTDLSIANSAATPAATITLARSGVTGTAPFRLLTVSNGTATGPRVSLSGLTLLNGSATANDNDGGGGLRNEAGTVSLTRCVLTGNTATLFGGGVYNNAGAITLDACTFVGNSAGGYGGGLDSDSGTVTISNSTFSGNTSNFGGALDNVASTLILVNSTLSGNTANSGGGGLCNIGGATTLTNCTVVGNRAPDNSGSGIFIYNATSAASSASSSSTTSRTFPARRPASRNRARAVSTPPTVTLGNTIVAGNISTGDAPADLTVTPGADAFTSNGYNLVGTGDTGAFTANGDQIGVTLGQLNLGALQNNGGFTSTLALQRGSLALNAGNPDAAGLPATDQRGAGFPRVVDGRVDVGAFEAQFVTLKGRVYNAVGRAGLGGITVTATTSGTNTITSALTDDQGNYTLLLDVGTYTITAGERFVASFTNPVTVTSAGTGNVSYDLRSIGIGGRVISPTNIGVQGVTLSLTLEGGTTPTTQVSDAQGFFSFDGLAAGNYTLTPSGNSNLIFTPTTRNLTLADTPLFTSFKAAARITYAIAGSVTSNGQGVEGVQVTATRSSDGQVFTTSTRSDGSYNFSTLTEDRYTIGAQATGLVFTYAPTPQQEQPLILTARSPGKTGINFTARRVITGTVYNAVALQGLRGMVVTAVRQGDGRSTSVTTDDTGAYRLELGAGTYTLTATNPNAKSFRFVTSFTNPLSIVVNGTATQPKRNGPGYDFRSVGIGGRVISPFNVGIRNVSINAYYEGNNKPSRIASTDENGFFSLDGLLPGNWTVFPVTGTYNYTPGTRVIVVQDQPVFTSFKASARANNGARTVGARSSLTLSDASANAQEGTLTLHFTGALDAASVADLSHYNVQVGGEPLSVSTATLSNGGDTLVLTLPEGALSNGDQITVSWAGLLDAQGLPLQGTTQLSAS